MPIKNNPKEKILEALKDLPESELEEVLDFVKFLQAKEASTSSGVDLSSLRLQQKSLETIWASPDEDLYEL